MRSRSQLLILVRLRGLVGLCLPMVLVFVLTLASVGAGVQLDDTQMGGATAGEQSLSMNALDAGGNSGAASAHAGACTHCGCFHASAVAAEVHARTWLAPQALVACRVWKPSGPVPRQELRPPIV